MDINMMIPLLAESMTNIELATQLKVDVDKYLEDNSDVNLLNMQFTCILVDAKKSITVAGGVNNLIQTLADQRAAIQADRLLRDLPGIQPSGN